MLFFGRVERRNSALSARKGGPSIMSMKGAKVALEPMESIDDGKSIRIT